MGENGGNGNGLTAQVGRFAVNARGHTAIILIVLAIVVAGQLWTNFESRTATASEHKALLTALNVQACMQSFDFSERKTLRVALAEARSPREAFNILAAWCPWMLHTPEGQ